MEQEAATPDWAECRRRLRRDAERLRRFQRSKFGYTPLTWFVDPAWLAVLLHRLSWLTWFNGRQKLGRLFMQLNSIVTGADIQPGSDFGAGLLIPSPCGVTLSGRAGRDFTALALAGVGGSVQGRDVGAGPGLPVLGDEVVAGPFTGIQGGLRMSDRVFVEGGAGALKDVPPGATMVLLVEPALAEAEPPAIPSGPAPPVAPCPHGAWSRCRDDIQADLRRYLDDLARYGAGGESRAKRLSARLSNPLLALWIYRRSHWHHVNGRPRLALALSRLNLLLFKLTITPESCLGGGALIPHLAGAVFCGRAGARMTLYANGLCCPSDGGLGASLAEAPQLGDDVTIGGHSGVLGPVRVGCNVSLAAKVQVVHDVPDGSQVFSPMARVGEARAGAAPAPEREATSTGSVMDPALPDRGAWAETWRRLRRDRERLAAATGAAGFPALTCVRLHRLAHALHVTGRRRLARWCWLANVYLTGADISPASEIGPGLLVPHPASVALHCRAGADLIVSAQSGIAPSRLDAGRLPELTAAPRLGDAVYLAPHSGVYGAVEVGSGVRLAPGCVLTRSAPAGASFVAQPLRLRRLRRAGEAIDLASFE